MELDFSTLVYFSVMQVATTILFFLLIVLHTGCQSNDNENTDKQTDVSTTAEIWNAHLQLNDSTILNFEISYNTASSSGNMVVYNGDEAIEIDEIIRNENDVKANFPVFDSWLEFQIDNDSLLGYWVNQAKGSNYRIPFFASRKIELRASNTPVTNYSGRWSVTFSPDEDGAYPAVGIFHQEGENIQGTFLTETGDYRFLSGRIDKDILSLSCLDGSHAFHFSGELFRDTLFGNFWSGIHWYEPFIAVRNDRASLTHPDSLTQVLNKEPFAFAFPGTGENIVRYPSEKEHVTILQVMGSWCPNCMDETAFLSNLEKELNNENLRIIALGFERGGKEKGLKQLERLKDHYKARYEFAYAGPPSKDSASVLLPMLSKILSFPTTIIIDKKGEIRKVHTGFYGPGTGRLHQEYTRGITEFVVDLLNE